MSLMRCESSKARKPIARVQPRGVAMLLVLFAVAVVAIMGGAFVSSQATSTVIASNLGDRTRAKCLAESTLDLVLAEIRTNTNWRSKWPNGTWVSNQTVNLTPTVSASQALATNILNANKAIKLVDSKPASTVYTKQLQLQGKVTVSVVDGSSTAVGDGKLNDDPSDPVTATVTATVGNASVTRSMEVLPVPSCYQRALMVVGNATNLSAGDELRKTQLKAWGWQVTILDDKTNSSDFDAAVGEADVVYVSSTVTAVPVANRLADSEIGVVVESSTVADKMNLGVAGTSASASTTSVILNAHYITQNLATGTLTLTTKLCNMIGYTINTKSTANGDVLARRVGSSTVFMILACENGTQVGSNKFLASRRVVLPWSDTAFDFSALGSNGLSILQRSLTWAAELDNTSTSTRYDRIALSDYAYIRDNAVVNSFASASGAYSSSNNGSKVELSTNSNTTNRITVDTNARIRGNVSLGTSANVTYLAAAQAAGCITGTISKLTTPVALPSPVPPVSIPVTTDKTISSGTTTLSTDTCYRNLTVKTTGILQISGTVNVMVFGNFYVQNTAQIRLMPGARLNVFVWGTTEFRDTAQVNVNTAKPASMIINCMAVKVIRLRDSAVGYFIAVGPRARVEVTGTAQLCGSALVKQLLVNTNGIFSLDISNTPATTPTITPTLSYTYRRRWVE